MEIPDLADGKLMVASALAILVALLVAGLAWLFSLPRRPDGKYAIGREARGESTAPQGLKPRTTARPLVAILGLNEGTETAGYLMTSGILRRADVADVIALSTAPGPIQLYPALKVLAEATLAEFGARYPRGADYLIVPAMTRNDDPAVLSWIREQAANGAIVIGVCAGARVVANAGLLDHGKATTHWYHLEEMLKQHPSIRYVPNRRFVADRGVVTTAGISASMPTMIALIEAIGGRGKAVQVAKDLGMSEWDSGHPSDAFEVTRPFALTVLGNLIPFWTHETLGIELEPGMDEVTLALAADAWSRTYRSRALSYAASEFPLPSRSGLRILPDIVATTWRHSRRVQVPLSLPPAQALERTLEDIQERYGPSTRNVVAMQFEYPVQ